MRSVVLALVLLGLAVTADAATWDRVQQAQKDTASGTADTLAFGSNTGTCNLQVMTMRVSSTGRTASVSDSQGHTWVQAISTTQATSGFQHFIFYYGCSTAAANTVSYSISGGAVGIRVYLSEWVGPGSSSTTDVTVSQSQDAPGSGNVSSSTGTTTVASELAYGSITGSSFFNFAGGGWTNSFVNTGLLDAGGGVGEDVDQRIAIGYRVLSSTQVGFAATATVSNAALNYSTALVTFKVAAAATKIQRNPGSKLFKIPGGSGALQQK